MQHQFGGSTYGNHDMLWLDVVKQMDPIARSTQYTNVSAAGMMKAAVQSGAAVGAVLYNVSDWHSIPTVVTLCGIHRALPLASAEQASEFGLPVLFDSRGKWASSLAAFQFAVNSLLPNCSKKLIVMIHPRDLAQNGDLTDLSVSQDPPLFTIWPEEPYPVPASGPNKGKTYPNGPASICPVTVGGQGGKGQPTHDLFMRLTEGDIGREHGWLGLGPPDRRIMSIMVRAV
jgi:hypothetical protein